MTDEQKTKTRARQIKYNATAKGRAISLRNAYKKIDECDLSTKDVYELIVQPCRYCGTVESPRGLDRIDNNIGHIKTNVVPACFPCNFARGDRFSMEEMDLIGAVIRQIMDKRPKEVENEGRL